MIYSSSLSRPPPRLDVPEPVYTDLVNWINREISDDTVLSDFVVESFGYITNSALGYTWKQGEGLAQYSNVSIFLACLTGSRLLHLQFG
ncbi:hypothetical protein BRARA_C03493 [Brassica rapa]|uniref:Uncharacterized protein n=1 Tax=Brassica campestris TaxID=3711 RepID=A0A398A1C4_BRACM|nr:hypothetical protein BRARA_C03493 [Brassica rapa]